MPGSVCSACEDIYFIKYKCKGNNSLRRDVQKYSDKSDRIFSSSMSEISKEENGQGWL